MFTGRKKKRQEERRRQKLLAEQAEMERQQTLGNMQDKVEMMLQLFDKVILVITQKVQDFMLN